MDVKSKIIRIIVENSENDMIEEYLQANDDLSKIGFNSISFIKTVVDIENEFDIEFEDEALDYSLFLSLENLCKYVKNMIEDKNNYE